MAVTGAIFNSLIFGGVNSADYGIYITGAGAFNAPERAVELVSIPGRNGAIAIDQGRYENIEVTYPAGVFGDDATDFRTRFAEFRNAMKSQIGYQRLTDTYNPNEYRMAMFIGAVEIDPVAQNKAGEFSIIFNCKPQRWLTSGETAVMVTSGGTLTNPTLYDSSPLLEVKGYGAIGFNGCTIDMNDPFRGDVVVIPPEILMADPDMHIVNETRTGSLSGVANANDTITIGKTTISWYIYLYQYSYGDEKVTGASIASESGALGGTSRVVSTHSRTVRLSTVLDEITLPFAATQSGVQVLHTVGVKVNYYQNGSNTNKTFTSKFMITYTVSQSGNITVNWHADELDGDTVFETSETSYSTQGVSVDSTVVVLGNSTYIDTEIGECYKIEGGVVVDLNSRIDLGSDLPTLAPGTNTITFDNTVTQLKVVPRWWIL